MLNDEENVSAASHKYVTTSSVAPSGIKGRQKTQAKTSEEVGALGLEAYTIENQNTKVISSAISGLKHQISWWNIWSSMKALVTVDSFIYCVPQEPEWDVSSAFFANAASHIRPKGSSRKSKENKENEARREVNKCKCKMSRSFIRTAVPKSVLWKSELWTAGAVLTVFVVFEG